MASNLESFITVEDVRAFWESHPLFVGESAFPVGSKEFFEEHRRVCVRDCLAGNFDKRILPPSENRDRVLDLGCGPGFWTVELGMHGCSSMTAADLTQAALDLTRMRCEFYGLDVSLCRENAEQLSFPDSSFSHVNCQGVIHHTPNTSACISEIHRVLRKGGTASISVYHKNFLLRSWPTFYWLLRGLGKLGVGLKGRGRENLLSSRDISDLVRRYDGSGNPIGRCYSRAEFRDMLRPYFEVEEIFLHFFPARALPFPLPSFVHRLLDRRVGFMVYASLKKR